MRMYDSGCRIFIHGLESSNKGTKSVFFREKFPDMIIPTFVGSLPERLSKLDGFLLGKSDIRVVGSSFGGLMGACLPWETKTGSKISFSWRPPFT